jgi:hypothetical protein
MRAKVKYAIRKLMEMEIFGRTMTKSAMGCLRALPMILTILMASPRRATKKQAVKKGA